MASTSFSVSVTFRFDWVMHLIGCFLGEVIEGMSVVEAVERQGSSSGAPKTTITIVDSGIV
jgi:hypothetical protein